MLMVCVCLCVCLFVSNGQLGFHTSPEWNSPQLCPKVCHSLFRKGVQKLSLSRHHSSAVTEDGDAYTTFIIDTSALAERCKFHKLKPKLHIKDLAATPLDGNVAIDLQGLVYSWEPNQLDDPKVDDTLETRHLHEMAVGLEHMAIVGTINKSWRVGATEEKAGGTGAGTKKS